MGRWELIQWGFALQQVFNDAIFLVGKIQDGPKIPAPWEHTLWGALPLMWASLVAVVGYQAQDYVTW